MVLMLEISNVKRSPMLFLSQVYLVWMITIPCWNNKPLSIVFSVFESLPPATNSSILHLNVINNWPQKGKTNSVKDTFLFVYCAFLLYCSVIHFQWVHMYLCLYVWIVKWSDLFYRRSKCYCSTHLKLLFDGLHSDQL